MKAYVIRRLLLGVVTFVGITMVCFALTRFLPGGPVEMRILRLKGMGATTAQAGNTQATKGEFSEAYRKELNAKYGFDKPIAKQYWNWMVENRMGLKLASYDYPAKSAWELIVSRLPISLWFGVVSLILTYLVSIPLGIAKALYHRSGFDLVSSMVVFAAYSMPSFALAMILRSFLSGATEGALDWFPLGGIASDFDLPPSAWQAFWDRAWHMFLPVTCYVMGSFAVLTVMMKNSLIDQISADYVRTVIAKGATRKRAVWGHAFRNALIPIATGLGSMISVMFAGSMIIETIFEIPGMGRLGWDALIGRDYPVFLALLALTSVFQLIGNLISDISYLIIDPRMNFEKK